MTPPSLLLAQDAPPESVGLWSLFVQSFDLFSVLLIAGSIAAVAIIVRVVLDVRESRILPGPAVRHMQDMVRAARIGELRNYVEGHEHFVARVVRAALEAGGGRESMREAAELAASEEVAGWFRRIEPLNIIGNLGPLVGLAGTVWGMIIAFTTLGEAGGEARAGELSLGISKALFHTLLGLCLAIPALMVFGFYRSRVDRICTRAMVVSSDLVEKLAETEESLKRRSGA